jgi:hypothetical protein
MFPSKVKIAHYTAGLRVRGSGLGVWGLGVWGLIGNEGLGITVKSFARF